MFCNGLANGYKSSRGGPSVLRGGVFVGEPGRTVFDFQARRPGVLSEGERQTEFFRLICLFRQVE